MHYINHAGFVRRGWYAGIDVDKAAIAIVLDHCPFIKNYKHRFTVKHRDMSDAPDGDTPWIYVRVYSPEKNCGYEHDPEFWFESHVVQGAPLDCERCAGTGWYVGQGTLVPGYQCTKCGDGVRDEKGLVSKGRGTGIKND